VGLTRERADLQTNKKEIHHMELLRQFRAWLKRYKKQILMGTISASVVIVVLYMITRNKKTPPIMRYKALSDLWALITDNPLSITSASVSGSVVEYYLKGESQAYFTYINGFKSEVLNKILSRKNITLHIKQLIKQDDTIKLIAITMTPIVLSRFVLFNKISGLDSDSQSSHEIPEKVLYTDIYGLDDAKKEIQSAVDFLINPV
jgi:ATP-dependent Zn protease